MSAKVHVKTGDTADAQHVQLVDHDSDPANLTGATVVMQVRGHSAEIACTIVEAAEGLIAPGRGSLEPDTGDDSKEFEVEFEVTYSGGEVQTFPEKGYATLVVWRDLDPA